MLVLVVGGSGSGKSEFAERLCCKLCPGQKFYIATMQISDAESERRVIRHRQMRAAENFATIECQTGLEEVSVSPGRTVLLECMSNLIANEMYSPAGRLRAAGFAASPVQKRVEREAVSLIMEGIRSLTAQAEHAVIVTNQVFSDGVEYDASTRIYMKILAAVNREIAAAADEVYEVVHGIPLSLKTERNSV